MRSAHPFMSATQPDPMTTPDQSPSRSALPTLSEAAPWLSWFTPPFEFGSFFAPEDTVLCALATRAALRRARRPLDSQDASRGANGPVVELTSGSALVLAAALLDRPGLRGVAAETDPEAVESARRNLAALGLEGRTTVRRLGLFSGRLAPWLRQLAPSVLACNPPYVPEPPSARLALVAGSGPRGDRHPRRVLRAAADAGVARVVLSWCSLGDPIQVMRTATRAGYRLEQLWVAAVADGEYTGGVHAYMRTLASAFLNEHPATLATLADDGSARFGYLLLAGSFIRASRDATGVARQRRGARRVARLMFDFRRDGLDALRRLHAAETPGVRVYSIDRWDELRLRMTAHGPSPEGDPTFTTRIEAASG